MVKQIRIQCNCNLQPCSSSSWPLLVFKHTFTLRSSIVLKSTDKWTLSWVQIFLSIIIIRDQYKCQVEQLTKSFLRLDCQYSQLTNIQILSSVSWHSSRLCPFPFIICIIYWTPIALKSSLNFRSILISFYIPPCLHIKKLVILILLL